MQKIGFRFFVFVFLAALITSACNTIFGPSSPSDTPAQLEQKIFNLLNDHRRSISAKELVWNDIIAE